MVLSLCKFLILDIRTFLVMYMIDWTVRRFFYLLLLLVPLLFLLIVITTTTTFIVVDVSLGVAVVTVKLPIG